MASRRIGDPIIRLGSVDSTNKYAAEALEQGSIGHGTVILAHEQTHGRGQRGRIWKSGTGLDIALSLVLKPGAMRADEQFVLAKMAALAVHDVVAEVIRLNAGLGGSAVRVKWPNDVLVDRRKVAGILIENELNGSTVKHAIIGIGVNVNSSDLDAEFNATSLRSETGMMQDVEELTERLCHRLDHYWQRIEAGDMAWQMAYTERLWSRDRFTSMTLDGEHVSARPMDVDPNGRLIVEQEDGSVNAFGLDRLRFGER
jgi:BirA family transcriptional regulator, biotin operon repressor / biotin---[acetyl-CoA-carboxylase] ligase